MSTELNAIVLERIEVSPGLTILRVAPDGWELPEFDAGQFAVLGLPGEAPRCDLAMPEESEPDPKRLIDTPSVAWLLKGTPQDPSQPGCGGRFVRAWERPDARFDLLTKKGNRIEVFGILELPLPLGDGAAEKPAARLVVEN